MEQHNKDADIYAQLFDTLPKISPPEHLHENVLAHIEARSTRTRQIRFTLYAGLSFIFALSIFPAMRYTGSELSQSGFLEYSSLLLTDTDAVFVYWREFGTTLLESAPLLGFAITGCAVLGLLNTLRLALQNSPSQLIHRYI